MEALIGVIVGFIGAFVGNYLLQERRYRLERSSRREDSLRDACVRLMTAVRELRYVARRKSSGAAIGEDARVDDVRTRVSTAFYEIEILAPHEVRVSARALRRTAFDYWNGPQRPGETWEELQVSTRKALDVFVTTARGLFKVTPYS